MMIKNLIILSVLYIIVDGETNKKPNIVIIMADDLGFNDLSLRGNFEIPTPNIDSLCYNGIILNRFYTAPLCTPSRSSFMTGKYTTKLGMQHYVIPSDEPWGLPLNEKLISEHFKEAGYKTALIGKWHLGFYKKAFTPTMRGFDYHFGYLGPYISYYDHSLVMLDRNYSRGHDLRRNLDAEYLPNKYATDLFTDEAINVIKHHNKNDPLFLLVTHLAPHTGNEDLPMEAPEEIIEKFSYIENEKRRKLAAMITKLDEGVGKIIEAIKESGILDDTIIMFLSDNGGPTYGLHSTQASNFPLRSQKGTVYEGGCRVPACIYSPLINSKGKVSNELMHITDLLPTFANAANISISNKNLDGINQWETIVNDKPTERKEILYNIESVFGFSALSYNGWKLMNGTENMKYSEWYGSSGDFVNASFNDYTKLVIESRASKSLPPLDPNLIQKLMKELKINCNQNQSVTECNQSDGTCLFNIIDDPCETNNLASKFPEIVDMLKLKLEDHLRIMVPSIRKKSDPNCNPKLYNFTWTWWQEDVVHMEVENSSTFLHVLFLLFAAFLVYFVAVKMKKKHPRSSNNK